MPLVTLIGEKQAEEGNEFIYLGPNNECRNCKLKTVCFNLKPYSRYKIKKIRDKKHVCNIHDGTAVVIEVEEIPIIATTDKKLSEGTSTRIEKRDCNNISCKNFEICNNISLQNNNKYKLAKILETIDCCRGYSLQKVELNI